jgi:orotidine-5'-phosphate decarboxylase
MSELFSDRVLNSIAAKGAPICVGIDPILSMLPQDVLDPRLTNDPTAAVDAIFTFVTKILRIVAEHVPIVKFQSAYFEQFYAEGVEAYYSLIAEAQHLGLLVIGDVKRGDIGSTSEAYAQAHLADPPAQLEDLAAPDAITVNPMMGVDTLEPFLETARRFDKGLFVLIRTSNPGSAATQDVKLADGKMWCEHLADLLAARIDSKETIGTHGFNFIGAVVGATQPHVMQSLRARLPKSIFLLPGYGTQGATADMTRAAFINGQGALVSASRSILYAHREKKYVDRFRNDWEKCVEAAVIDMKRDVTGILSK